MTIPHKGSWSQCGRRGCRDQPRYFLEWHGLNQHLEDPIPVARHFSCDKNSHIYPLSQNNDLGGPPDAIYEILNKPPLDIQPPDRLLTEEDDLLDGILAYHNPNHTSRRQLDLFDRQTI